MIMVCRPTLSIRYIPIFTEKSLSLRKTKTDKVDSRTIATMMMSDMNLKSYSDTSYHNEELKSLTRYRFDKVKERAKLKVLFQDLSVFFSRNWKNLSLRFIWHPFMLCSLNSQVQMLLQTHTSQGFPTCSLKVRKADMGKDTAVMFRDTARRSIGSHMPAKSLELKHTIKLIRELTIEIDEIEAAIKRIMDEKSILLSLPFLVSVTGWAQ